jgi:hypothetical protein
VGKAQRRKKKREKTSRKREERCEGKHKRSGTSTTTKNVIDSI